MSIITLNAEQTAHLEGLIVELNNSNDKLTEGIGDSEIKRDGTTISDELVGTGSAARTQYQLARFPVKGGTLDLRKTSISGDQLVETTHYTVVLGDGDITLTAAGVDFLESEDLHAAYQTDGVIDVDATIRAIQEAIATNAILPLEKERKSLTGEYVTSAVAEADIITSIEEYDAPLYPKNLNDRIPSGSDYSTPSQDVNLFGGSGTGYGPREKRELNREDTAIIALLAVVDTGLPSWDGGPRNLDPNYATMTTALLDQLTALGEQKDGLDVIIAAGDNEYVSVADIAELTSARAAVVAQQVATQSFYDSVTIVPIDLSNANLTARQAVIAARISYIDGTRTPALDALLTTLWDDRFTWITIRARRTDGTLTEKIGLDRSISGMTDQIARNDDTIDATQEVLDAQ